MRDDKPIEVTVILFDGGYSSTAVAPIEVFHSAGLLWHSLHGEPGRPRFRVRSASVDDVSATRRCGGNSS